MRSSNWPLKKATIFVWSGNSRPQLNRLECAKCLISEHQNSPALGFQQRDANCCIFYNCDNQNEFTKKQNHQTQISTNQQFSTLIIIHQKHLSIFFKTAFLGTEKPTVAVGWTDCQAAGWRPGPPRSRLRGRSARWRCRLRCTGPGAGCCSWWPERNAITDGVLDLSSVFFFLDIGISNQFWECLWNLVLWIRNVKTDSIPEISLRAALAKSCRAPPATASLAAAGLCWTSRKMASDTTKSLVGLQQKPGGKNAMWKLKMFGLKTRCFNIVCSFNHILFY